MDLSEAGLSGLRCLIQRKQWEVRKVMERSQACYVKVLSGAEDITFLDNTDEDYDSVSDLSDDDLE